MIILIHVVLALVSLTLSAFNFFVPSKVKLIMSYLFATGTLASGVMLIFVNSASVLRTCLTGIVFFGVVTVMNELSRKKLQTANLDL